MGTSPSQPTGKQVNLKCAWLYTRLLLYRAEQNSGEAQSSCQGPGLLEIYQLMQDVAAVFAISQLRHASACIRVRARLQWSGRLHWAHASAHARITHSVDGPGTVAVLLPAASGPVYYPCATLTFYQPESLGAVSYGKASLPPVRRARGRLQPFEIQIHLKLKGVIHNTFARLGEKHPTEMA